MIPGRLLQQPSCYMSVYLQAFFHDSMKVPATACLLHVSFYQQACFNDSMKAPATACLLHVSLSADMLQWFHEGSCNSLLVTCQLICRHVSMIPWRLLQQPVWYILAFLQWVFNVVFCLWSLVWLVFEAELLQHSAVIFQVCKTWICVQKGSHNSLHVSVQIYDIGNEFISNQALTASCM